MSSQDNQLSNSPTSFRGWAVAFTAFSILLLVITIAWVNPLDAPPPGPIAGYVAMVLLLSVVLGGVGVLFHAHGANSSKARQRLVIHQGLYAIALGGIAAYLSYGFESTVANYFWVAFTGSVAETFGIGTVLGALAETYKRIPRLRAPVDQRQ